MSARVAQAGQEVFADLGPGTGSRLSAAMGGKTFGYHAAVPVRYGDVLGTFGNTLPERLNVLELLVWGEFVEAGGWNGRLRHAPVYDWSRSRQPVIGQVHTAARVTGPIA